MKLLVTGGAGFIGSNFVYHILKHYPQHSMVVYDLLTYASNLTSLHQALQSPQIRFVQGDIADITALTALFSDETFDAVVNFAAESHVDRSIESSNVFLHTNVLGIQALLDASRTFQVQHFHQVSTDEVYGDLPLDRPDLLFSEDSPLSPSSPYSASKAAGDLLALAYHRTYKLPVTISRCSNNYGPYQHPEKLIPKMTTLAMQDQTLPVYGNGQHIRDWLYVEDTCEAIATILHHGKMGQVYNVGGNEEHTNRSVVETILNHLAKPHSLITQAPDRAGHDLRYGLEVSKIQTELGWKATTPFQDGLAHTVRWYQSNINWWTQATSE